MRRLLPLAAIVEQAVPLEGTPGDYDRLLQRVGSARVVLLGGGTWGTHEFYEARVQITRRLIEEKNFSAVALEADWPDAYRLNRYVQGAGHDATASQALQDFHRFPRWLWRNRVLAGFAFWLRLHNQVFDPRLRVSLVGLDLLSHYRALATLVDYLEERAPRAAARARKRFDRVECFGQSLGGGPFARSALGAGREEEALSRLQQMRQEMDQRLRTEGFVAQDEFFYAVQQAQVDREAKTFDHEMIRGSAASWNLREQHMATTLAALTQHLESTGRSGKIVVWGHNSQVGDARATDQSRGGQWNLGHLARERFGDSAVLVGFTTYEGTVSAASDWDRPVERKWVRPALPGSFEEVFHQTGVPRFLLILQEGCRLASPAQGLQLALGQRRLLRMIGAVYQPQNERAQHYLHARLAEQFDVLIHMDQTRAVEPLEREALWERGEVPQAWPWSVDEVEEPSQASEGGRRWTTMSGQA